MLLKEEDQDKVIHEFASWSSSFTDQFWGVMEKFHWQKKCENGSTLFVCPSPSLPFIQAGKYGKYGKYWKCYRKKGTPFLYSKTLWNPYYELFYKNFCVATIHVSVLKFDTYYTFSFLESTIEIIHLVEQLGLPDLCQHSISQFLFIPFLKS